MQRLGNFSEFQNISVLFSEILTLNNVLHLIMSGVRERISQFIKANKMATVDFEKSIGVSNGYISSISKSIQPDKLEIISDIYPNLSIEWLLIGKGEMLKTTSIEKASINYEYKGAPYYNVDFIGGFDLVLNDQTRNPDYYIDFAPYNKDGVVWCNITGHSMEPELNNGDFIAMKEMTDPIEYLPYGEVYGIVTDSYRTVKRMTASNKEGFVHLIPTNKSPEFQPQDIPVSMIRKVYAVLGSMHRLF